MLTSAGTREVVRDRTAQLPFRQLQPDLGGDSDLEQLDGEQVIGGDAVGDLRPISSAGEQLEEASGVAEHRAGRPVGAEIGRRSATDCGSSTSASSWPGWGSAAWVVSLRGLDLG